MDTNEVEGLSARVRLDKSVPAFQRSDQDPPQCWPFAVTKEPDELLSKPLPVLSFIHQHLQSWLSLLSWWRAHTGEEIQCGVIRQAQVVELIKWEAVTSPLVCGKLFVEEFNETVPWSGDPAAEGQASVPALDIPTIHALPAAVGLTDLHKKFAARVSHRGCVRKICRRLEFHRREWLCLVVLHRHLDQQFSEVNDVFRVVCRYLDIQVFTSLHGFHRNCLFPVSCGWETEPAMLGARVPCPHCSGGDLQGPRHLRFSSNYHTLNNVVRLGEEQCVTLLRITSPPQAAHVVLKHIILRRLALKCLTCERRLHRPGWYCCLACPQSSSWNHRSHTPGMRTSHSASCCAKLRTDSIDPCRSLRWCPFPCLRLPASLLTSGQATSWWSNGRRAFMRDLDRELILPGHNTTVATRADRPYITGFALNNMKYEVFYVGSTEADGLPLYSRGMVLRARSGWQRCDGYDFLLPQVFERMQSLTTVCPDVD